MRHVLIELAHLIAGLIAVGLLTEVAAWSYPPGREALAWLGWLIAAAVVLWSVPQFRAAWRKDRGRG